MSPPISLPAGWSQGQPAAVCVEVFFAGYSGEKSRIHLITTQFSYLFFEPKIRFNRPESAESELKCTLDLLWRKNNTVNGLVSLGEKKVILL